VEYRSREGVQVDAFEVHRLRDINLERTQALAMENVFDALDAYSCAEALGGEICDADGDYYCLIGTGRRTSVAFADFYNEATNVAFTESDILGMSCSISGAIDVGPTLSTSPKYDA
jgi:hypothetical protein